MFGRSTVGAINLLRHLMRRYRDKQKDLYIVFMDQEKAYDNVPREVLWRVLRRKKYEFLILIKDIYHGVKTCGWDTKAFATIMGLHQGSAFSPYLLTLVMDELIKHVQA